MSDVLSAVAAGTMTPAQAEAQLKRRMDEAAGFADLGYARADLARAERQGAGEVIYGEGKTAEQVAGIAHALVDGGQPRVLITRLDAEKAARVERLLLEAGPVGEGTSRRIAGVLPFLHYPEARLGVVGEMPEADGDGTIAVVAAGTSDVPVAMEAVLTARFLGNETVGLFDVGVAGIHRLLSCADELACARVVVAVAGMEGALASVVGGMVPCPVIAVPTSVGYGASFGGVAALLAMLNSCASGVSVVNIDNGFGAAYQASLINHAGSRGER